ncbi:hypothetical protein F4811DRAFT_505986 [Daldinia bambusicola]|nr:hypothetical protein F4811DRAFT_505986 [Daldinia bambusicola]
METLASDTRLINPVKSLSSSSMGEVSRSHSTLRPLLGAEPTSTLASIDTRENRMADAWNKFSITTSFMKLYINSMENALTCWINEDTCPLEGNNTPSCPPSIPLILYERVYRLDTAFSKLRCPLTREEQFGSSKALKLAIMAFSSQFSSYDYQEDCVSTKSSHGLEPEPIPTLITSEGKGFEHLMRQSLWNEARRCLDRWQPCGSFRVILASIIFAVVQQRLDEDEIENLRKKYTENYSMSELMDAQLHLPDTAFCVSSMDCQYGLQHLETATRHLLSWKRIISSSLRAQNNTQQIAININREKDGVITASWEHTHFNLLFWLIVMFDTTSSLLNRRPLAIPDSDIMSTSNSANIYIDPALLSNSQSLNPNTTDTGFASLPTSLWNSLIDIDKFQQEGLVEDDSICRLKTLQKAVPLKVLFWNKVAKLQDLVSRRSSSVEIEGAVKEALYVREYWIKNYSEFFENCVREHHQLSFQVQSWYLVLGMGWNLACLILTKYIDYLDENSTLGGFAHTHQACNGSSNDEMKKISAYAIAELGRASCSPTDAESSIGRSDVHFSLCRSAILADPHTAKVVEALETACNILLVWISYWQSPVECNNHARLEWLHANTDCLILRQHCARCIETLKLLAKKSDISGLAASRLTLRYRMLGGK